jgi:[ribosomal protein S5]-alanine N-acetyltransferase
MEVGTSLELPTAPIVRHGNILLRPYCMGDAHSLAALADNPKIARNMRNQFPSPYRLEDAVGWLSTSVNHDPLVDFTICKADGTYVGGIGLIPGDDVEHRTFEMGYWLGEPFWGQGLATDAAFAFSRWTFAAFPNLIRLQTQIYDGNVPSTRVVTKAGFTFEGRRRKAVEKGGRILDVLMFSMLREECGN